VHIQFDPVFAAGDFGTGFDQFCQHCVQNIGAGVFKFDAAAGNCRSNQVGACFDTVGKNVVVDAVNP
jgi:hypothetical protein